MNVSIHFDLNEIGAAITDFAGDLIRDTTLALESEIKLTHANSQASGRIYQRGARTHQASARGEAPAVDTGYLLNSIFSKFPSKNVGIVGIGAEYAVYLESEKYLDRPFVNVSIDRVLKGL